MQGLNRPPPPLQAVLCRGPRTAGAQTLCFNTFFNVKRWLVL